LSNKELSNIPTFPIGYTRKKNNFTKWYSKVVKPYFAFCLKTYLLFLVQGNDVIIINDGGHDEAIVKASLDAQPHPDKVTNAI